MPVALKIDIKLQPKQQQLFNLLRAQGATAATWIGYGGSRGGSKSGAIRRCALALACQLANITVWIFRRVFGELKADHIDKFREEFQDIYERYYKIGDKQLLLPNGSKIAFVYAENLDEVIRKFRGPEAMYIFVDQAEQLSEEELYRIHDSARAPGVAPGTSKLVLCFNPGGIGTEFLRRVFWLKQYKANERAEDFHFIQSYGWDNYEWFRSLTIPPDEFYSKPSEERFQIFITETDYGRKLNALPPALRVGELLGSFEHFAGQYFAGVWEEEKCVLSAAIARAMIQPWWTCWESQDWGFQEHACHLWWAAGKLSPKDARTYLSIETEWPIEAVVVYRELIVQQMAEADLMMKTIEMTPADEQSEQFYLSPDAWAKRGSANTVAEQFGEIRRRYQFPLPERADDDRVGGWRFLYSGFRQSSALRGGVADEERAKQGPLLFISADCPGLISSIPLAVRDEKNLEDVVRVPGVLWEDVTDALRYGFKSKLGPKSEAPRAIRRQMVYDSQQDMTARALAVRRFDEKERQKLVISRTQRWR